MVKKENAEARIQETGGKTREKVKRKKVKGEGQRVPVVTGAI